MKKILLSGLLLCAFNVFSQVQSLDTNFGTGGKVVTSITGGSDKAYGVALQADGKIIVAGMATSTISGRDFACVRYNADGSLDTTFGTAGIVTTDIQTGSDDVAYSLAIQADGKIVLAGYSDNGSNKNAAILRLNADGTIDTSFGTSGKVLTDFIAGNEDEIKTVKIHALTGNIVVGGTTSTTSTASKAIIARYTPAGLLDTTFHTTGIADLPNSTGNGTYYYVIEDLMVKSNGKITATGWINQQGLQWSADYYTCRLNNDGTLDTSFATDGVAVSNGGFNANDKAFSMLLNPDDSILFSGGGYLSTLEYDYFLGYYDAAGASAQGKAEFDFGVLKEDVAYGMGMDSAGRIILAGSTITSETSSLFGVARVKANYSVDTTFGTSGKLTTTFGNTTNEAFDVAIQSDDKIIAVGYTGNDFAMARYNATTTLSNESFDNSAVTIYPNPVANQLNISNLNDTQLNDYQIYDINGRVILKGKTMGIVNVEQLSKGIYVLKLNDSTIKFIKK